MATFTHYSNILPDPNNKIGAAGQTDSTGSAGPGFASVQLVSDQPTVSNRTKSQRISARAISGHKWNININYNPMTLAEFNPVYTFLLDRVGPINPFYISLPQYKSPQDSTFSTAVNPATTDNINLYPVAGATAGSTTLLLTGSSGVSGAVTDAGIPSIPTNNYSGANTYNNVAGTVPNSSNGTGATFNVTTAAGSNTVATVVVANPGKGYASGDTITISNSLVGATNDIVFQLTATSTNQSPNNVGTYNFRGHGTPSVGDLFTVSDAEASNHTKAYMVTRVETRDLYEANTTQPEAYQVRIKFTPGLSKTINNNLTPDATHKLNFYDPQIRVVMPKALNQYSLNTNNLYKFSLKLEEAES